MHTIKTSICDLTEDRRGLVTEASSAGLAPGEWPDFISVIDDNGIGFLFQRGHADRHADDMVGVYYVTRDGRIHLLIIND